MCKKFGNMTPEANVKNFFVCNLQIFVISCLTVKPFKPSLLFAGKDRAYPY
jgi:hypothetical protein